MAITGADFEDGSLTGTVEVVGGKAVILKEVVGGLTVDKRLKVELRSGSTSGTLLATTNNIDIRKGDSDVPYYSVSPSKSMVAEGEEVVFSVMTSNVEDGTGLFWSMEGVSSNGSAALSNADFTDSIGSGGIIVVENRAEVRKTLAIDSLTEGLESFKILIRTGSTSGTVVAESVVVNVSNVSGALSAPVPSYSVTPSSTNIVEGGSVTFNVVTVNVEDGTVIDWVVEDMTSSIGSGEIQANDFLDNTLGGVVTIQDGKGSIIRQLKIDNTTEGDEAFKLVLIGEGGMELASSPVVRVIDSSATATPPNPTYLISPDKASALEGQSIVFSIVTTNVTSGTVLYWDTELMGGDTQASDFVDGVMKGTVTITNNQGTITRQIADDLTASGVEQTDRFKLRLRVDSPTGLVVASSPEVSILDKPPTVSPPPTIASTSKRLGTNLVELRVVNPLRNLIKGAKPLTSIYPPSALTVNQYGYPTSSGTYTTEFPVYQSGAYILYWEGSGTVTVSANSGVEFLTEVSSRKLKYQVTVPNNGLTGGYRQVVKLNISGVDTEIGIENLIFCREQDLSALLSSINTGSISNQFLPELVDDLSLYYSVVRFNELMGGNQEGYDSSGQQVLGVWGKRQQVLDMTYDREVPIELIIQLCNETACSPWLSIHLLADEGYISALASYVKQHLDPTLYVYLEYSNELWNEDQSQHQQFKTIIAPSLPPTIGASSPEYQSFYNYSVATKSGSIFRAFKTVFTGNEDVVSPQALSLPSRVTGLISFHIGAYHRHLPDTVKYANGGEDNLNWYRELGIDAISTQGYFMFRHPVGWMPEAITMNPTETANNILQALLTNKPNIINLQEALGIVSRDKDAATPYGLRTLVCEGGHHIVGKGNGEYADSVTQAALILFADPQFKELVRKHISDCMGVTNDVFCHYCWRSKYSVFSLFGLREGLSTTPSLLEQAIQQVAQTLPAKQSLGSR